MYWYKLRPRYPRDEFDPGVFIPKDSYLGLFYEAERKRLNRYVVVLSRTEIKELRKVRGTIYLPRRETIIFKCSLAQSWILNFESMVQKLSLFVLKKKFEPALGSSTTYLFTSLNSVPDIYLSISINCIILVTKIKRFLRVDNSL